MPRWISLTWIFIVIGVLPVGILQADQTNSGVGTIADSKLDPRLGARPSRLSDSFLVLAGDTALTLGPGPRPVAMGGAFIALADDVNATVWNPAGLGHALGAQVGFAYGDYLDDGSLGSLSYTQSLFSGAGFGISLVNAAGSLTGVLGYGQRMFANLALGLSLSRGLIKGSSDTGADLGVVLSPGVDGLQLGTVVRYSGTRVDDSHLPLILLAGVAYQLPGMAVADTWTTVLDARYPLDGFDDGSVNLGTEYSFNHLIAGRAGYIFCKKGDLGSLTGFTAGVGLKFSVISLDYAILPIGTEGFYQQIALNIGGGPVGLLGAASE